MSPPRVDYSLFGPPVTMAPGLDAIGQAVVQVQQRREAKAAAAAKARAEYEQWAAEQAWKQRQHGDDMAHKGADLDLRRQTEQRHQTEGDRSHERDTRRIDVDAYGRAVPLLREGDAALAQPFLRGQQPQPDALQEPAWGAEPAAPPQRRMPPMDPLWDAMEQRRAALGAPQQSQAQPPPMDQMDAIMADRKRKAQEVGGALSGSAPGAVEQAAAKQVQAMVEAGAIPRADAGKQFRAIVDAEKNREIARMRASRAGGGKGGIKPGQKVDDDRALATTAHAFLGQQLNREDYKALTTNVRAAQQMIDYLGSDNPAMHKMALGIWAKQAAGPGAVTESERDMFVNSVGGKDEKVKLAALNWLSNGEAPESMRRIFVDGAKKIIMGRLEQTIGGVREEVYDSFATHPNETLRGYADWAANRTGSYILGRKAPAGGGGKDKPAGGGPASAPTADPAKRAAALEKLKALRGAR